jgi:hypothetical protein
MEKNYSIVRTIKFDQLLIDSWEKAYLDFRYKFPLRANWLQTANPFSSVMPESIIYIKENNEAVAWTSVYYHQLKVCDQEIYASFAVDTFTLDTARGKGYASIIQKMSANDTDVWWGISLSPANRRIFLKIGFYEGKELKRYFKLLTKISKKHFFAKAKVIGESKKGIVRSLYLNTTFINLIYNISNYAFSYKKRNISNPGVQLEHFESFGSEHDSIYENIKNDYHIIVKRDKVYLNWRYNMAPFYNYKKFNIKFKGQTVGYLVYRVSDDLQDFEAVINEFLLLKEYKYLISIVYQLIEDLIKKDGGRTLYIVSSEVEFSSEIEQLGFVNYGKFTPIMHLSDNFKNKNDLNYFLGEDSKWYMSYGDHDLDQYGQVQMQPDFSFFLRKIAAKFKI